MDAVQQKGSSAQDAGIETRVGRRRFSADYKQRILAEVEGCKHGEIGLLLRREGLYSSTIAAWRKQQETGGKTALAGYKRGRKSQQAEALKPQCERLQRELKRVEEKLRQAELIIDFQKKLCTMLGLTPAVRDL